MKLIGKGKLVIVKYKDEKSVICNVMLCLML